MFKDSVAGQSEILKKKILKRMFERHLFVPWKKKVSLCIKNNAVNVTVVSWNKIFLVQKIENLNYIKLIKKLSCVENSTREVFPDKAF